MIQSFLTGLRFTFFGTALLFTWSCSDDTKFQTAQAPEADLLASPPIEWQWNCKEAQNDGSSKSIPTEEKLILKGPGPHALTFEQIYRAPILFTGNVCNGELGERLVTFVVDVSGSMHEPDKGNDPLRGGTCERMRGIDKMIDNMQAANPNSKFSLITFNDRVVSSSTGFFDDKRDLYRDLVRDSGLYDDVQEAVCASFNGTKYDTALQRVLDTFLAEGTTDISRQVFFISDGEPDSDSQGIEVAEILKTQSTIATVMIGKSDEILREHIASRDDRGQAIHARIENAGDLTEALSSLTDNYLEQASLLVYSDEGEDEIIDLRDQIDGFKFSTQLPPINPKKRRYGLTVELSHIDRFGNEKLERGELTWAPKDEF